jgi:hypothetical protein
VVSVQLFLVFDFDNAFDNRKYVESYNSAGKGEDGLRRERQANEKGLKYAATESN